MASETVDAQGGAQLVVVVDGEPAVADILSRRLAVDGHWAVTAASAAEARALIAGTRPAALLADAQLPGQSCLELLAWARAQDSDLAVVMVSAVSSIGSAVEALKAGASDYILKPLNLEQVSLAVARALARRRLVLQNRAYREELEEMVGEKTRAHASALAEIQATYDATLGALGAALSYREGSSPHHSRRVAAISVAIARRMGLPPADVEALERAALLHDIGKIAIPDCVLTKPGRLDGREYALLRDHPRKGYELLSRIAFLRPAADIVHGQGERYDGSGYPRGLAGDSIPLGARIFAIANAYDAMTAGRFYQRPVEDAAARAALRAGAGTQFDPRVVEAFLALPPEAIPPTSG